MSKLLLVDIEKLTAALISNTVFIRGEEVNCLKHQTQAEDGRDALAKALYGRMFSWIVGQINNHLQAPDKHRLVSENILLAYVWCSKNYIFKPGWYKSL